MAEDDTFLSRWSRRKVRMQRGELVEPPPLAPLPAVAEPAMPTAEAPAAAPATSTPEAKSAPPPPNLEDVAALTKESDYSRFVAGDVDPGVKNAAMKKLFASDPHFNTMDGLDVYIDDYNKFEPLPRSILRQLVNARAMGLIDDELDEQPRPDNPAAPEDAAPALAPIENADLQLQPDDAAGPRGAGQGLADGGSAADPLPDPVPPRGA
jgi:hypothetical protein